MPHAGRAPSRERPTTAGAWAGTGMSELAPAAVDLLRTLRVDTAWGADQEEQARAAAEAGFADAGTRRLTDRGAAAATVLQNAQRVSRLTITGRHGRHRSLELHALGDLVVAIGWALPMPGLPDEALLGIFPVERSAELVLRSAALGPSDSRVLSVDTVPRDLLVQRSLVPSTPLPAELADDPRWADLWDGDWLLWALETEDRTRAEGVDESIDGPGEHEDTAPAVTTLIALNAGRHGNQVVTRPAEDADETAVRLVPAQTSSLLITLLTRLTRLT